MNDMNDRNDGPNRPIDVICQINKDGTLFPIKVRLTDEDGMYQTYAIRSYRRLSAGKNYQMPNGILATATIFPFECKINCFGKERTLRLSYHSDLHLWRMNL